MSFWDVFWLIVISYLFFAYIVLLFSVLGDLLRDTETGGFAKALWVIAFLFLPFLSLLLYLVVRGRGMSERSIQAAERARAAQEAYVREIAGGTSPVDQVAKARSLLDAGAITDQEYTHLKDKALTG